jgi:hypothetical protein
MFLATYWNLSLKYDNLEKTVQIWRIRAFFPIENPIM